MAFLPSASVQSYNFRFQSFLLLKKVAHPNRTPCGLIGTKKRVTTPSLNGIFSDRLRQPGKQCGDLESDREGGCAVDVEEQRTGTAPTRVREFEVSKNNLIIARVSPPVELLCRLLLSCGFV